MATYIFKTLAEIKKHIGNLPSNSLVVFDLDNTVIKPIHKNGEFGGDIWYEAHYNSLCKAMPVAEADIQITALFNSIQKKVVVEPVELEICEFIKELQEQKHKVVALTARGVEVATITKHQLASIGIDFDLGLDAKKISSLEMIESPFTPVAGLSSGIIGNTIYCAGKDKGACLVEFMKYFKYDPNGIPAVLFMDDKKSHVTKVDTALSAFGIKSLHSVHYTQREEAINQDKNSLLDVANVQMQHFLRYESDQTIMLMSCARAAAVQQREQKRLKPMPKM